MNVTCPLLRVEIKKSEIQDLLNSGPSSGGYHRPPVPAFAHFQIHLQTYYYQKLVIPENFYPKWNEISELPAGSESPSRRCNYEEETEKYEK